MMGRIDKKKAENTVRQEVAKQRLSCLEALLAESYQEAYRVMTTEGISRDLYDQATRVLCDIDFIREAMKKLAETIAELWVDEVSLHSAWEQERRVIDGT